MSSLLLLSGQSWVPSEDRRLGDWYVGSDLANGAVASWTSRKFGQAHTEATNRPVAAAGRVLFDGSNDKLARAFANAPHRLRATQELPDAAPTAAGHGFGATGLARAPDGTWWVGNDGRNLVGDVVFAPSLVHLSGDFKTNLGEILLAPLYPGIQSVQGVAYDTSDNTLWFCDVAGQALRHISLAGAPITGDQITGLGFAPNGLAYNPTNDRLFVSRDGNNTIYQYSCAAGTLATSTATGSGTDRDQLFYDAVNGVLWMTNGAAGAAGIVTVWHPTKSYTVGSFTLAEADAIEGLWVDVVSGTLYLMSNGWEHTTPSNVNRALTYDIVMPYANRIDWWGFGKIVSFASSSDVIFSIGEPLDTNGFAAYVASLTSINLFANTGASGTTERASLTATVPNLTADALWYFIFETGRLTARVNGTQVGTTTFSNLVGPLWYGREFRMAAALATDPAASLRFCNMDVKEIGTNIGGADIERIEGYLAARHNARALLPANHPYKMVA